MSKYVQIPCVVCGRPFWAVDARSTWHQRKTCSDHCLVALLARRSAEGWERRRRVT